MTIIFVKLADMNGMVGMGLLIFCCLIYEMAISEQRVAATIDTVIAMAILVDCHYLQLR